MVINHTMDEYKEMGIKFKLLSDLMVNIIVKVERKYGAKMSHELKKINRIRSDLEDQMYREHPQYANTGIFYGIRPDINKLLKMWEIQKPDDDMDED